MTEAATIKNEGEFSYLETEGGGTNLVLLHGLMGALSNFETVIGHFGDKVNVTVPLLPIFEIPILKLNVDGLVDHIVRFIEHKGFDEVIVLGNSLGGHLCQLVALRIPEKVKGMVLTGSSGLFESAMGNSFPKRGSYEYIKEKTEMVFHDPKFASKALVDEVYEIVNDRGKCIRVIKTAKSAVRHNLGDKLHMIKAPTLLVWGKEDEVTPAWVGEKFHELLPNSTLHIYDNCGHVPMMEKPTEFNAHLTEFLDSIDSL